jgi:hypothetical protein
LKFLSLAALLAAAPPLIASAADAADPAVAVPRLPYRSVFEGAATGVEEGNVPWKKANQDVAQFPRGHIDLLKWEEAQGGARKPASPSPGAAPAAPAAAPQPAARPRPPAGHQHEEQRCDS